MLSVLCAKLLECSPGNSGADRVTPDVDRVIGGREAGLVLPFPAGLYGLVSSGEGGAQAPDDALAPAVEGFDATIVAGVLGSGNGASSEEGDGKDFRELHCGSNKECWFVWK